MMTNNEVASSILEEIEDLIPEEMRRHPSIKRVVIKALLKDVMSSMRLEKEEVRYTYYEAKPRNLSTNVLISPEDSLEALIDADETYWDFIPDGVTDLMEGKWSWQCYQCDDYGPSWNSITGAIEGMIRHSLERHLSLPPKRDVINFLKVKIILGEEVIEKEVMTVEEEVMRVVSSILSSVDRKILKEGDELSIADGNRR